MYYRHNYQVHMKIKSHPEEPSVSESYDMSRSLTPEHVAEQKADWIGL